MRLSDSAWQATFAHPEIWTEKVRESLFKIYDEVSRMNALRDLFLAQTPPAMAGVQRDLDPGGLGIRETADLDFLNRAIREALELIASLSPPG
jgi:hypothetical protein